MNATTINPRRRLRRWIGVGGLLLGLAGGGWLLDQFRPRDAYFTARRGHVIAAESEPPRSEAGGFVSQAVRVQADTGLTVNLRVLRPESAARRLPLVVVLGGHRTGRDAVHLIGAPGPMVVAALDYPYDGPERPRGLRQSLAVIPAARQGLLDTPPAVLLALDWLLAQPWVDPDHVELMGVSLGVPFAAVAGALEPRVRRVWLIHGGADNRRWIEHNLRRRMDSTTVRSLASWLVYLLARGPAFEAGEWAARCAPRPVMVVGARDDARLPERFVEQLHAAVGEPCELIWTEGGHVDRRPENVHRLLEIVRTRVLETADADR